MPFRDLGFNFTYYYFINSLVCDGKGTATFASYKKSGEIFSELLRQGGNETTKLAQGAKNKLNYDLF